MQALRNARLGESTPGELAWRTDSRHRACKGSSGVNHTEILQAPEWAMRRRLAEIGGSQQSSRLSTGLAREADMIRIELARRVGCVTGPFTELSWPDTNDSTVLGRKAET